MADVVAHVDAEQGFSGGEVQVFLLMEGLRARGWKNVLFCPPGSRGEAEARARGFDVVPVAMRNDLHLLAGRRIARGMREHGCTIAHLHTGRAHWLGGLAAKRLGIPAITTRRMDRPVQRGVWTRVLYGLVKRAVAISPAVEELLERGGVPESKRCVIFSSVDPEALRPKVPRTQTRALTGVAPDDVLLLVLARLTPRKGIDVLLEALCEALGRGRVPRTHLWIAGDGPETLALRTLAERLELEEVVSFLGRRDDKADLLAAADVVCMPSRAEGLGVASLEAMAAARPVLACEVGGLADAVEHDRTGLLVPPDDVPALRDALLHLLREPDLRERLGQQGPKRIREGFHCEQMVAQYEALYREVLAEG